MIPHSSTVAKQVIHFAKNHGRYHLPWKSDPTPYRVWISEVMLQQTQVQTVIDYFQRFMQRFPDVQTLAQSPIDDVLAIWAGLGYYRRAHFIHQAAIIVNTQHQGIFPQTVEGLMTLPGIGRSTAGAILSQALNISAPILDGNVKRVLMRLQAIKGYPDHSQNLKKLWSLSEAITPKNNVALYTQGIMDLGALICTKKNPSCNQCPLPDSCSAFKTNTQHLYPEPKPAKTKITRRCYFSVLINAESKILLLKRPSQGIWGGLWCLPAMKCLADGSVGIDSAMVSFTTIKSIGKKQKHVFTHFNLEYKPVIIACHKELKFKALESRWLHLDEALALGLPAPIKKLLEGISL